MTKADTGSPQLFHDDIECLEPHLDGGRDFTLVGAANGAISRTIVRKLAVGRCVARVLKRGSCGSHLVTQVTHAC